MEEEIMTIKAEIANVLLGSNRTLDDITIVAATKTIDAQTIALLPKYGIKIAGENRANEFSDKFGKVSGVEWHFIGSLQTNKVKNVVGKVALIQSVDRLNLAQEINKQSAKLGVVTDILLEVNIGEEESKSGVKAELLHELIAAVLPLKNVRILGLMTVLPKNAPDALYIRMKQIYDKVKNAIPTVKYLSMGMSDDYIKAIKYGSNMARLGRKIFGERKYNLDVEEKL